MKYVVGIDEAGRGPLAGPVAVGVVAVRVGFDMSTLRDVRDSKQLSPKKRDEIYAALQGTPGLLAAVAMVGPKVIDEQGIVYAVLLAMKRALKKLDIDPTQCSVLLDGGLKAPEAYMMQKTIIRGDATEPLIGAASILAKVTRDRYMTRLHRKHPEYGFAAHKGYGTKVHREAITVYGPSEQHRSTFCRSL